MKRILCFLLAMMLLCAIFSGCSFGDFLSGTALTDPTSQTEQTVLPEQMQEMASEAVMNEAQRPEVLQLAYQEDYGLNPFTTVSLNNRTILSLLYEPLFIVNSDFQPEPVLAATAEVSDDGRTTTITMRYGPKFHNGDNVTAKDVVYSYQLAKESDYYGNRFYYFESFEAINSRTIVLKTSVSYEKAALLLDFPVVRDGTGTWAVPDGSGPFTLQGGGYQMVRYEDWWQDNWFLGYEKASLTPCTTAADIRDHYEYGQVNLVCSDPSSASYAAFHYDYELWSSPTTIMQYIGFNHNDKVFGLDAVRSAITYAINRETIVAEDLGGCAVPATLPASPLSPCYNAGLAADYEYDMTTFRQLLGDAQIRDYTEDGVLDVYVGEYSVPLEGTMIVNASSNQRVATAQRIADYLNTAGFNITVKALEEDDYQDALEYQNFDMYYGELRMSNNFDMGSFFRDYGSANFAGSANSTGLELSLSMLENSGNGYDLHKWVMDKGWICPILFKSYAVYTTRGAAKDLNPAVDWIIH